MSSRRNAFSLVELAIVLIIVGLLIASISVGQKLIENARVRSAMNEINRLDAGIASFQLTYDYLPGDLINATSYWPSSTNGDGDELIEISNGSSVNESNFVFEQLTDATLISGGYSSGDASTTTRMSSKVKNAIFEVYQDDDYDLDDDDEVDDIDTSFSENVIVLEGDGGNTAGGSGYGALMPRMAYNIDSKMDDGVPDAGKVRGMGATSGDDTCYSSSEYTLSLEDPLCDIAYYLY